MKFHLLLVGALALSTSAARAQTSIPGSVPATPADASSAGSPRAHRRTEKVPGMSHSDKKRLRKMVKVPTNAEGTPKIN